MNHRTHISDIALTSATTVIGASLIGAVVSPVVGGMDSGWAPWLLLFGVFVAALASYLSHQNDRAALPVDALSRIDEQTQATNAELARLRTQVSALQQSLDYRLK